MNQAQQLPSTEFFRNFITDYGRAWDNYDLQTILDYYYMPCFIFKAGQVFANVTEEVKHLYFKNLLDNYKVQNVAHAEIPHCEIKLLGDNSALITVEWVCKRGDGTVVFDFWDSYHLIHIDAQWKILDDTVHDPAVYQA